MILIFSNHLIHEIRPHAVLDTFSHFLSRVRYSFLFKNENTARDGVNVNKECAWGMAMSVLFGRLMRCRVCEWRCKN